MRNSPIGVFDSGIGGLTVLKELIERLPNESFIYLGDTARVPYGTRSKEVITKFSLELTDFLVKKGVKCLVVSCNTISSTCLGQITQLSGIPVIGVVEPATREASLITKNNRIGVIGTNATISSRIYEKEFKILNPKIKLFTQSGSLFVPLIEGGLGHTNDAKQIARDYLSIFKGSDIDTLILGCTHFPMMTSIIQEIMGKNVILVDPAKPTAEDLENLLVSEDLITTKVRPTYEILVTDAPKRVSTVSERFWGGKLPAIPEKVTL